jgi:hypothetical protein
LDCAFASLFVVSWNLTRSSFTFLYKISSIENAFGRFTKCCCNLFRRKLTADRLSRIVDTRRVGACVGGCSSQFSVLLCGYFLLDGVKS